MSEREQVGWIDEFGNCFPLNAWQATYHDDDKGRWKPLYTAPQSAAALRSQVAVLRESLLNCRNHIVLHDDEGLAQHSDMIEQADLILSDTEAAAKEYERELRNRALEEAAQTLESLDKTSAAETIQAMKETT